MWKEWRIMAGANRDTIMQSCIDLLGLLMFFHASPCAFRVLCILCFEFQYSEIFRESPLYREEEQLAQMERQASASGDTSCRKVWLCVALLNRTQNFLSHQNH